MREGEKVYLTTYGICLHRQQIIKVNKERQIFKTGIRVCAWYSYQPSDTETVDENTDPDPSQIGMDPQETGIKVPSPRVLAKYF